MTTPANDTGDPLTQHDRSSEGEKTAVNDESLRPKESSTRLRSNSRASQMLNVNSNVPRDPDGYDRRTPSQAREHAHRMDDELRLLQIERQVSEQLSPVPEDPKAAIAVDAALRQERSREGRRAQPEVIDEFDVATNPIHLRSTYRPPENPSTSVSKFFKRIHQSSFLVRWFTYIAPVTLILLIPLLIGGLVPGVKDGQVTVGGVDLLWFMIWLEIVWLTLWLGRLIALSLPYPIGIISSLFTNSSKKWRDLAKQLELAATLFFWWLAIEISFLPTMTNHQVNGTTVQDWQRNMNKVLIAFLVLAALNLVEKIMIQLIAISFHQRTYEDRIEINRIQIDALAKLYTFSRLKLQEMEDSDFEQRSGAGSGARTPGAVFEKAQRNTQKALNQVSDVAGKIAGDFTGRAVKDSSHPSQVVLALLRTTGGSQILARRLYRTFAREETQNVYPADLEIAFTSAEEAEDVFSMFDKDMNGDISMDELEAVCVEIGRERKAITASLKDLDSVVSKLDNVFMFIVVVISVLVLIALISSAAAAGLSNAGSVVLGLSWLFSATATEFLQSIIFVFVKHPFDVGDRVTIYGQTGATYKGDDYFVKEIALLYTEFKKMEGHIVQAPNSYLNTLFILNIRRSGGLAEAVPMTFKFGTTSQQIHDLREYLVDFVTRENREYQSKILTELRDVVEAHSITLNIVFFFKSNWQNELLRLQRRNKFIIALMEGIHAVGIEGPRMRYPGQKETFPLYTQMLPFDPLKVGRGGNPDNPNGIVPEGPSNTDDNISARKTSTVGNASWLEPGDGVDAYQDGAFPAFESTPSPERRATLRGDGDVLGPLRSRGLHINTRTDNTFGANEMVSADVLGDVFDDTPSSPRLRYRYGSQSRHRAGTLSSGRPSHDVGRTSSAAPQSGQGFDPGSLFRRGTAASLQLLPIHRQSTSDSIHRNRFFGSLASPQPPRDRGSDRDIPPSAPRFSRDSSRQDHGSTMEQGMAGLPPMADIPERPTPHDSTTQLHELVARRATLEGRLLERMDPRSGTISPAIAVRMDSDAESVGSGGGAGAGANPPHARGHGASTH